MDLHDLLSGLGAGLVGGFTSGLLGISPGGGLVVFSVLLLGAEQHVAQGISLVAQIPPTSMTGIKRYWEGGSRSPLRWLVFLTIGFVAGGVAGAASHASSPVLQWTYVAYLLGLRCWLLAAPETQLSRMKLSQRTICIGSPCCQSDRLLGYPQAFWGSAGALQLLSA